MAKRTMSGLTVYHMALFEIKSHAENEAEPQVIHLQVCTNPPILRKPDRAVLSRIGANAPWREQRKGGM